MAGVRAVSLLTPSRVVLDATLQSELVKTLCIVFGKLCAIVIHNKFYIVYSQWVLAYTEILEGPVPQAYISSFLDFLPQLLNLAMQQSDGFPIFGHDQPANQEKDVASKSGEESTGDTIARCVINLLRLIKSDKMPDMLKSIDSAKSRQEFLLGVITVFCTHLKTIQILPTSLHAQLFEEQLTVMNPLLRNLSLFFLDPNSGVLLLCCLLWYIMFTIIACRNF
jgi:hypothetical protein